MDYYDQECEICGILWTQNGGCYYKSCPANIEEEKIRLRALKWREENKCDEAELGKVGDVLILIHDKLRCPKCGCCNPTYNSDDKCNGCITKKKENMAYVNSIQNEKNQCKECVKVYNYGYCKEPCSSCWTSMESKWSKKNLESDTKHKQKKTKVEFCDNDDVDMLC